ncbi:DUF58 domain-containing protein [Luteolibacter luteus]|uniref:DUF58 domain-containing protein n=1 Tax=Luteolibacter luteus TaxID=2728835 RepID=A0A858RIR2_9BACT|nr:DUF58 domain-containing protein [Luteolibacter luteus]QJE96424.1 DUF58 domain-containing protein [Luteolibacter luteus]
MKKTGPWSFLQRFQYRTYSLGTAFNFFLKRRIRPTGIGVLLVIVVSAGAAAGNPEASVYQSFALACSLSVVALLSLPFRRAKLEALRDLPAHATAGQELTYHISVRNLRKRSLRRFELIETPPDPRPSMAVYFGSREPGEEERNVFDRRLAWYRWNWLAESRLLFEGGRGVLVRRLKPGGFTKVAVTLTPLRRGVIRMNDLRVLLPDPLGLFQRCQKISAAASSLAVLPRRFPLPHFELPGSARFQPGGEAVAKHAGATGEFTGLRDYQPGDPLRLIHWATWARTGKPVVKELEDTFFPRHGLILDTFPDPVDADLFEDAVSVAASFVVAVDAKESLIDLMFIAGHERVITAGQGIARAETLLEVLAGVESSSEEDFESLARLVLRHGEDLAGCLCVFSGWSESRAKFLTRLNRAGIETSALIIVRDKHAAAPRCHFLRHAELEKDLMRLPRQL